MSPVLDDRNDVLPVIGDLPAEEPAGKYAGRPNDAGRETLFQLKFPPFWSLSDGVRALGQMLSVRWRLDVALPGMYVSGGNPPGGMAAACFMEDLKGFRDDDEMQAADLFHTFLGTWRDCLPGPCQTSSPLSRPPESAVARALNRIEAQGGSSLAEIALFAVRRFAGDLQSGFHHRRAMICLTGVLDLAVCCWLDGGISLTAATVTA